MLLEFGPNGAAYGHAAGAQFLADMAQALDVVEQIHEERPEPRVFWRRRRPRRLQGAGPGVARCDVVGDQRYRGSGSREILRLGGGR